MGTGQRRPTELTSEESLQLLKGARFGRIVFTSRALPAIRLARHVVDDGDIVLRGDDRAAVVSAADGGRGVVVAYQADLIDPEDRGWSVLVTGTASLVGDPDQVARYRLVLPPWLAGETDQFIRIHPAIITGFRLGADEVYDRAPLILDA
jgi:pyridoxamine 5'-phosphate oxidase-like protein